MMLSQFKTPHKIYNLTADSLCCNKFGLAEFFANHYSKLTWAAQQVHRCSRPNSLLAYDSNSNRITNNTVKTVLDVGCGVGPLGIYLADCFNFQVTGVELNPIACACCNENINALSLCDKFVLFRGNFNVFEQSNPDAKFDMIVSNPPLDSAVPRGVIEKYAHYHIISRDDVTPELFSYLTNSWHNHNGLDLQDLIFLYGKKHLNVGGRIITVFCLIDCASPDFILDKARCFGYGCDQIIQGQITSDSIGAESVVVGNIDTLLVSFKLL